MGRPIQNLVGSRYGELLVIGRDCSAPSGSGIQPKWMCECSCGKRLSVFSSSIKKPTNSVPKSCGCKWSEEIRKRNTTHGIYGTKLYWSVYGSAKRARRFKATPKWADAALIQDIYSNRPDGFDVDHVVPLTSPIVCGLHWEGNLQYLPSRENQSKKNRYWPDMPEAA